jgi:hypothetical protein
MPLNSRRKFHERKNKMKVSIVSYDDLPENEKGNQPSNGCGKEDANYLKIEIPGKKPVYESDAMESEDARFTRDLSWIKGALLSAYQAGKEAA